MKTRHGEFQYEFNLHTLGVKYHARPFLKWAGGKGQLLEQISNYLPNELVSGLISNYVEPFVGGGAVLFYILQNFPIKNVNIFDTNPELIIAYKTIKSSPNELIDELSSLETNYQNLAGSENSLFYYKIRKEYNEEISGFDYFNYSVRWVSRTSRTIFLNRTCFNGLFRVNSKGEFNVPFGDYKHPKICDPINIRAISKLLSNTTITLGDFSLSKECIKPNSFVYFDPPYRPISVTSSFNSYSRDVFNDSEQLRLAKFFREMSTTGAKLMLSNSDPQNNNIEDRFFEEAYQGFEIQRVKASRMINSKHDGRGQINELLIMNYQGG